MAKTDNHLRSKGMAHKEMSKEEHREHHCSDGQRHSEGRYEIANQEMHDSFANEKKHHGK